MADKNLHCLSLKKHYSPDTKSRPFLVVVVAVVVVMKIIQTVVN